MSLSVCLSANLRPFKLFHLKIDNCPSLADSFGWLAESFRLSCLVGNTEINFAAVVSLVWPATGWPTGIRNLKLLRSIACLFSWSVELRGFVDQK